MAFVTRCGSAAADDRVDDLWYITKIHKELNMEEKKADINLIFAVLAVGLQIGLSLDRLGEKIVEAAKIVSALKT